MKKKKEIPSEYKCSRCGKDMRDKVELGNKCICSHEHPRPINKTGIGIYIVQQNYEGFSEDYPFIPIDL